MVDVTGVFEHRSHQPVGRAEARLVRETHLPRDGGLEIGGEAVGPLAGLEMERAPRSNEELLGGGEGVALPRTEQRGVLQRKAHGLLEPADRGDVAEPADTFFQIRLEEVRGRTEPIEPVRRRLPEPGRERRRVVTRDRPGRVVHALEELRIAHEEPRIE